MLFNRNIVVNTEFAAVISPVPNDFVASASYFFDT